MIEFSFRVRIQYRDAQAFIGQDLEKVHQRLAQALCETIETGDPGEIIVEVEPV